MSTDQPHAKFKASNSPSDTVADAKDKIVHDLKELRNDAQTLKRDIKDAAHTLSDAAHDAAQTTINAPAKAYENVKDNPLKSVLVALMIGFIFGKLHR